MSAREAHADASDIRLRRKLIITLRTIIATCTRHRSSILADDGQVNQKRSRLRIRRLKQ
jgi:hypothetical protein